MSQTREGRYAEVAVLASGTHTPPDGQWCVMEAAAYVAGEPWGDEPACVAETIGAFLRSWNDVLPDEARTRLLRPLIPAVLDTRRDTPTEVRLGWLAVDWLVRVQVPAWARLVPTLHPHAVALAGLPEITAATWAPARPLLDAARDAAVDARAAAMAVALDAAALDVALDVAWAAAWAGAKATALRAAAAGGAAGGAAARDPALAAAVDIAWAAAWAGAGAAAWVGAWSAVGASLAAPVASLEASLQASAVDLVLRMCQCPKEEA